MLGLRNEAGSGALWCSLLPDEFVTLTMSSANKLQPPLVLKPILTFPKGRNKLPCFVKDLFSQSLQPPLVLPRRGDADYSGSAKDRGMQVTQVLSKTGRCWLLLLMTTDDSQSAKGICPSPTGEDRWGLKFID